MIHTLKADKYIQAASRQLLERCLPNMSKDVLTNVQLGLAEALQNIVRHGYRFKDGQTVSLSIKVEGDDLRIEIFDHATPCRPEAFLDQALTPSEEGGMGILLIKKLTHHFSITPLANGNLTVLVFNIGLYASTN